MKVKIDEKLICIPPYVSTTWDQVCFLQSEEEELNTNLFTLTLHLSEGKEVQIPHLDSSLIDIAFSSHIKYLESKGHPSKSKGEESKNIGSLLQQLTGLSSEQFSNIPIRFGISGLEGLPGMEILQHNQANGNSPDIPADILDKMASMIKMMTGGDMTAFPKPEPHCNCPHCQVSASIHGITKDEEKENLETPVDDEDLKFREWDITKKGDQLYIVTNPIDSKEYYSVFLGTPVGCTCGQSHCEHIKAVLYS